MSAAKQANTMRRKADKSGNTSVWPAALATANNSSKDMTRAAKSPSTMQKSKLSAKPGTEKMASSSLNLRAHKATPGTLGAGKTQVVSLVRTPSTVAKRRMGTENSAHSIQRTRSVPARQIEAPKVQEQEVDLLMEFDEMESISTPSIEEHLRQRLPDPIELEPVDVITYAVSEDARSEPSSNQEEYRNEDAKEHISEQRYEGKDEEDLTGGENADVGINSEVNVMKKSDRETELKEDVDETKVNEAVNETELNQNPDETELNEAASETGLKEATDETKLNKAHGETELKEAVNQTESKDAVVRPDLIEKEEGKVKEDIMLPTKAQELAQRWRKDEERDNEVTEETRRKQERKNKVMALVGKFETVISG
ncbi:hypothetical protein ACP70R_015386 [Stipagrostis hirtigluma subsp. patula]